MKPDTARQYLPYAKSQKQRDLLNLIIAHEDWSFVELGNHLQTDTSNIRRSMRKMKQRHAVANGLDLPDKGPSRSDAPVSETAEQIKKAESSNGVDVNIKSSRITSYEEAIEASGVDLSQFRLVRKEQTSWEVAMREPATTVGGSGDDATVMTNPETGLGHTLWTRGSSEPQVVTMYRYKLVFEPISPVERSVDALYERLRDLPPIKTPRHTKTSKGRALEIDLFDAHIGLKMANWTIKDCTDMIKRTCAECLEKASRFGSFDHILWPFGHDWGHIDTILGTTTKGTAQPEAGTLMETYIAAEECAIDVLRMMLEVAPVQVKTIPGNHDQVMAYSLGRILHNRFYDNKHVTVECEGEPYVCWSYGNNMCFLEHGHSIQPVRIASLMATTWPELWAKSVWREAHFGDKHRSGKSGLITFEEYGVTPEFFAGLTPTNEWHKMKAFTNQVRHGLSIVWDKKHGREATLPVFIDKVK